MTPSHPVPRALMLLAALALAAGCSTRQPAPVEERTPVPLPPAAVPPKPAPAKPAARPAPTHTIKRGETLVGIALQYGLDYRELAAWNSIVNPNLISVGQVLVLAAPAGAAAPPPATVATPLAGAGPVVEARPLSNTDRIKVEPRAQRLPYSDKALAQLSAGGAAAEPAPPPATAPAPAASPPVTTPAPAEPERPATGTQGEAVDWIWPVKGKVIAGFTEATKGIDIAGKKGAPVVAAAAGRVVYAGQGLRGYGKLVIIKHNEAWLSAYAHNDNIVVKEQQDVKRGQKIAEMGSTDTDQVKLHFEVRRQGKPVDPAKVLPTP